MTEPPYRTLSAQMMRLSELTVEIWKKMDPYCQRQKCSPETLLSAGIRFMRLFVVFPWWRSLKRQWGSQNQRFLVISVGLSSEPLELKPIFICGLMKYLIDFPLSSDWLWMTLKWSLMLKSVFIVGFTRFFCLAFGDNCVKTNEDTPILSATKYSSDTVVPDDIKFIRIFSTVLSWRGVN